MREEAEWQLELEERRAAAEEARTEARERREEERMEARERKEAERLSALAPTAQATGQARLQASQTVNKLRSRYPTAFAENPQYVHELEQKIIGVLLAPENAADPFSAQKTIGDIEFQLANLENRLAPKEANRPAPAPVSVQGLRGPSGYRTSSHSRPEASAGRRPRPRGYVWESPVAKKKSRRRGGGIAGVICA